ncbi:MAG: sugar phosphate nucleotidyltransferase [Gemmatimonadota bacterium]|jgi:glucose-1-phosphate thymidylyltransferase
MQAILPLAGKGTRLRPHTHTTPKPLLRVGNRTVLDRVLDLLEGADVTQIIGIMGHLSDRIEAHLAAEHPELGFIPVMQTQQLGTADAIRLAEPHVEGPVLIVFVDTLFRADMELIQKRTDVDGIVWAKEVEDYQRFGVIVHDADGYMQEIIEKPTEPISRLANIGLYYVRNVDLLFEGIHHVMQQPPKLGEYFLTDAFQYMIDNGGKLLTAEVAEWWDCGKPETLIETNLQVLKEEAKPPRAAVPGVTLLDPVRIGENVTLENATIGPNVSVADGTVIRRSRVRDSIVGADSEILDCDLSRSLVGDHVVASDVHGSVSLGDHSEVRGEST